MIQIKVSTAALKVARERIVQNANRRYRAIVYKMFEEMLLVSAQYSGEFTANWQIAAGDGYSEPSFYPWPAKDTLAVRQQPHAAGDAPAIDFARLNAARRPFTYKDKVYFVNATPLVFGETTVTGPDGKTENLRPENIIGSGELIQSYVKANLPRLAQGINPAVDDPEYGT